MHIAIIVIAISIRPLVFTSKHTDNWKGGERFSSRTSKGRTTAAKYNRKKWKVLGYAMIANLKSVNRHTQNMRSRIFSEIVEERPHHLVFCIMCSAINTLKLDTALPGILPPESALIDKIA